MISDFLFLQEDAEPCLWSCCQNTLTKAKPADIVAEENWNLYNLLY